MAKWGASTDSFGIVNPNGNGGAAQVWKGNAVDKILGSQANIRKEKAIQEAKAKADKEAKQKANEKALGEALKVDTEVWRAADGQKFSEMYNGFIDNGAKVVARGGNPKNDPELIKQKESILNFAKLSLEQQAFYNKSMEKVLLNADGYAPEKLRNYFANAEIYKNQIPQERNNALLVVPDEEEVVDWRKALIDTASKAKQDLSEIEDEDGTTTNKATPEERAKVLFGLFLGSKEGQEALKIKTEKELETDFNSLLPKEFKRKLSKTKGGLNINFGGGTISSDDVKAVYSPDAYKTLEAQTGTEKGLGLGEMQVNPDGAITFESNGKTDLAYKSIAIDDGREIVDFKAEAIYPAAGGGFEVVGLEKMHKNQTDDKGVVTSKTVTQKLTFKIDAANKEAFEEQYLGGTPIEDAFGGFKSEYGNQGDKKDGKEKKGNVKIEFPTFDTP